MIMSYRVHVYDSVYHMTFQLQFYRFKSVFISMKTCIFVTDLGMALIFPSESAMLCVVIKLFMT